MRNYEINLIIYLTVYFENINDLSAQIKNKQKNKKGN